MVRRPSSAALQGVGVLVTRPAHQAGALCALIEQHGGTAIRFPVLEIQDPADPGELEETVWRLDEFDLAVFISANAVNRALGRILARRDWPQTLRIAVIGRRSAEELTHYGLQADIFPERKFNSEALLALPEMQDVSGQRIVIFRGDGGREYLADTLRERGARVEYVEAYRRVRPESDNAELLRLWHQGGVSIVLVNSADSLKNLLDMVGAAGVPLLTRTPLLVVSERLVGLARQLGFTDPPVVAENATDHAVLDALLAWRQSRSPGPAE